MQERLPIPGATLTSANPADPPRMLVTGYRVAAESCATDSFRNDHRNSITTYMQHEGATTTRSKVSTSFPYPFQER
jgi:hypothetical protein